MSDLLAHVVCCNDHDTTLCGAPAPAPGVPGRTCLDCLNLAFEGHCPLSDSPCGEPGDEP